MVCNHYIESWLTHLCFRTGVPVAWILLSNGTVATIAFFLNWVKTVSPGVQPSIIMTDHDIVQLKAIKAVYPNSQIFLCIWHVLRAIRSHFVPEKFQSLWAKVKSLVKTEDSDEFDRIWTEISTNPSVPQSFMEYLTTEWKPKSHMWSLSNQTEHTLLEESDTNMLIEVYVISSAI
jgi:MULE transposase domain